MEMTKSKEIQFRVGKSTLSDLCCDCTDYLIDEDICCDDCVVKMLKERLGLKETLK